LINSHLSDATLSDVIARAPFGVVRIGPDMNVMDANPRLALLFLAKADEMAGSPISRYFSPDEAAWVMHQLRTLSTGSVDSVESETQALRADRSTVWLAWSASAVRKASGEIDYYIAMFEDRTAKHQAEVAAARNLNVLERLSRLKTEFLTTVSHELRTALVGIQGFSELIRDAESLDLAEVKSFADEVYSEARRLDQMLDKMLELDRAPGSRTIPHITDINLNTAVHDAVGATGAEAHRHHVVANLELVLPMVKGDAALLRQVISILLSNAFKYSPEGSEVVVSSRADAGYVQISVKDHGLGMPADFDEQLFGRHQRNADNPAAEVAGSGLGLPIARQIIELHGGSIWFEGAAGVGSEFHFTIPTPARPPARSETL
jgi:PAS domain S-box-containing protein